MHYNINVCIPLPTSYARTSPCPSRLYCGLTAARASRSRLRPPPKKKKQKICNEPRAAAPHAHAKNSAVLYFFVNADEKTVYMLVIWDSSPALAIQHQFATTFFGSHGGERRPASQEGVGQGSFETQIKNNLKFNKNRWRRRWI